MSKIDLNKHPEDILTSLTDITIKAIDRCFPPKKLSNRAKRKTLTPWFDSEIYKGEKKQSRLFRRFVKTKNPEDYQIYIAFRKNLSKLKYRAKRTYYRKLLSEARDKEDRSATWEIINQALGKKGKSRIYPETGPLANKANNQAKGKNRKSIPNALNTHFVNIAKKLAKNLKKTNTSFTAFMGNENRSSMYLKEITLNEIMEEIAKICTKKAMGYDRIPPKIIKWAPDIFAPILLTIYNKCLDLGYYPNSLKIAKVIPISGWPEGFGRSN